MEALGSFHTYLKNCQHQAGVLADAVVSLSQSFEAEAKRLSREDEASRLKAVYSTVVEQLGRAESSEMSASHAQSQMNQTVSTVNLGMSLGRAMVSKGNRRSTFSNSLGNVSIEKLPYGTVIVCVGAKGLPDDVRVVSISELARESNRPESEIIRKLQKGGCLLFGQERFSRLIDKLVIDIREGRLHLPILSEKLPEVETLKLEARKGEWVRLPRPQ